MQKHRKMRKTQTILLISFFILSSLGAIAKEQEKEFIKVVDIESHSNEPSNSTSASTDLSEPSLSLIKESEESKSSPKTSSNLTTAQIRNELGENIKVVLNENKIYYLSPYKTTSTGPVEKGVYYIYVYNFKDDFLGVLNKKLEGKAENNIIVINSFNLHSNVLDQEDPAPKEKSMSENLRSKKTITSEYIEQELETPLRKIKIANISSSDVHISILKTIKQNIGNGWSVNRGIYEPELLLFQGQAIEMSPEDEIILGGPKEFKVKAKDLRIDDDGSYIWIIK